MSDDAERGSVASEASQLTVTLQSPAQPVVPPSTSRIAAAGSISSPRSTHSSVLDDAGSAHTSPSATPPSPRSVRAWPQERRLHAEPVSYSSSAAISLLESTDTEAGEEAGESGLSFTGYSTFSSVDAESSLTGSRPPGERRKKRRKKRPPAPGVPFPSQVDPSKPLRPKHYRKRKAQRGVVRWFHRSEGMLLFALAQAFVAACFPLVELLGEIDTAQILLAEMAVCALCSFLFLVLSRTPHPVLGPPGVRLLLFARGLMGILAFLGLELSLRSLDPSDTTALLFMAPAATALLGALFLDEPVLARETAGAIVIACGTVLLTRPASLFSHGETDTLPPGVLRPMSPRAYLPRWESLRRAAQVPWGAPLFGLLLALLGVLALASSFILIRHIGTRASPVHSVGSYSLLSGVVLAAYLGWDQVLSFPGKQECVFLFLLGFLVFSAEMLMALGLQRSKAGRTVSTLPFQLLFTVLIQGCLLRPLPPLALLGAALIVLGAAYISLTKR